MASHPFPREDQSTPREDPGRPYQTHNDSSREPPSPDDEDLRGIGLVRSPHSTRKTSSQSTPGGKNPIAAFGSSLRLVSHARLYTQFAPFGITFDSFQALLRALRIPSIHLTPGVAAVDSSAFYVIMHAILAPGEPDFVAPSCPPPPVPHRTSITTEWLHANWEPAVTHLLDCRRLLEPQLSAPSLLKLAREASARLLSFTSTVPVCEVTTSYPDGTFDCKWLLSTRPLDNPATIPPCPPTPSPNL